MRQHNALITGGAGFIGTNLAIHLASMGCSVTVLDNFSRMGSRKNADHLDRQHGIKAVSVDIRNYESVRREVEKADIVYHLAAQVAVTTSVDYPKADFEVNALGTLNVLEAARLSPNPPIVFYSSTNKVYGDLAGMEIVESGTRYDFVGGASVSEDAAIDLKTPYGCSKGNGDLYAQEYARSYGLRTVTFRQSCIYGPFQNGTEDQGWVAHFLMRALNQKTITIFGDGKQVRDLLYVDDLVRAICAAVDNIEVTTGQVYNIGGGRDFSLSVWSEFSEIIRQPAILPSVHMEPWRPNDQKVYISDIGKANHDFGWLPVVPPIEGIGRLFKWLSKQTGPA